ncbi:MAG: SRPBCC family protein [Myxococcota bacterium]
MRQLIATLTVAALLIAGGTFLWGWPGAWGLIALGPGLLLGSVLTHLVDTWVRGARPRLIFTTLAGSFGTLMALFALMVMAAASSPAQRQVAQSRTVTTSAASLWAAAAPVELWGRWEALVREARPPAQPGLPTVGARYDATMLISGREVPAELEIVAWEPQRHIRWRVLLAPGSAFEDMTMDLGLAVGDGGTTATFTLSYTVPGVTARAIERWALRPILDASAAESVDALVALAAELAGGD